MKKLSEQCIVFDLDGTLVDTVEDIAAIINTVLQSRGFPGHSHNKYKAFIGWGLSQALDRAIGIRIEESQRADMLEELLRIYSEKPVEHSFVYPGMMDLLYSCLEEGWRIGLYSNKNEEITAAIVRTLFPDTQFDFVLGAKAGLALKPDPAALIPYLKDYDLMLMIGDSPVDVETSIRAGIPFAGVTWGFRSEEDLIEAGSMNNFSDADSLKQWINDKRGKI